jgi:hypothetical protein
MKLKYILENKILVPRRSKEERAKSLASIHYKQIQEYIKNGSEGGLDLIGTPLKILPPNLIRVGGYLHLEKSQITSLNNLEYVGWSLDLNNSQVTSLGNLEYVGGSLWLEDSQITSLGNLEYIGYNLWLRDTPISKTHTEAQIRQQVKILGEIIFEL